MKNNNIRPTGLKGNDQVNRMRSLMGMTPIKESTNERSNIELTKVGPDGRVYGIVKENHEYYIKIANNKPNLVVEDFNYIGGLRNKKEEVYESYAKAIKHLNLKFISINEARGIKNSTNTFTNDIITENCDEPFSESPKPSQPDSTLGTVKEPGKNDGHEEEIIDDAGETGNPDVDTPPIVEEGEDSELTESERAIDRMIIEGREIVKEEKKEEKVIRRMSIAKAMQNIDEAFDSKKKK